MARKAAKGKQVADYRHEDARRVNNPPAGLAWQDTEKPTKRRFEYDPHLDPQLIWAGKAERQSFEVEAPSIHVHERLSADDILRSAMKEPMQPALFDYEELDRSKVVDFYKHDMGWENRLILGDSLVVMTSLLEKERLGGRVQTIYLDPPYGVKFNSNFQPRISSTKVRDRSDQDLTREPEQVQAFRDTWTLGVHSYLSYLRDRCALARELLSDEGSIFVQIGDENVHRAGLVLDEIFGASNRVSTITVQKTSGFETRLLANISDYLLWYAKDIERVKYRPLYIERGADRDDLEKYDRVELLDGVRRAMTREERADAALLPTGARRYERDNLTSQGTSEGSLVDYEFEGKIYRPGTNSHWKTTKEGLDQLAALKRIEASSKSLRYVRFADDFPARAVNSIWDDTSAGEVSGKRFVVQTPPKVIARALLMTSDPGDLVLDPTCGSGTTAAVAEEYGRRWITCDTSRVALAIARERLVTASFDFFELANPQQGIAGGFNYRRIGRTTLRSLAYGESAEEIALVDWPHVDNSRARVSGPFTVEALSRYAVNPNQDNVPPEPSGPQEAEAEDHVWTLLDALTKQGIPRKGHRPAKVLSLERLTGTAAINGEGHYEADDGVAKSFAVSIGPRFGPVTVRQIDDALHDSYGYDLVVFAGYAAAAEAQDYVAPGRVGKFNVALLEANPDLLVADLLKQTSSSQTFRLFAAPDIKLNRRDTGDLTVEVLGVDLFDAATGATRFVGDEYVAAWFLDTDYDGLVFRTRQAFFPNGGWERLAKTLKGTVDDALMDQLERFESLPFEPGENRKAAVRVVDDAGTTSEVVLDLE